MSKTMIRILCLLLTVAMLVSTTAELACAADVAEPEAEPQSVEQAEVPDDAQETSEEEIAPEDWPEPAEEQAPVEASEEEEPQEEVIPPTITGEGNAAQSESAPTEDSAQEELPAQAEGILHGEAMDSDALSGMEGDDLFAEYVEQILGAEVTANGKPSANRRVGSSLTGVNAKLYQKLLKLIAQVAAGQRASTVFTITAADLGLQGKELTAKQLGVTAGDIEKFTDRAMDAYVSYVGLDVSTVVDCLLEDAPYYFYWYDKTTGYRWDYGFSWRRYNDGTGIKLSIDDFEIQFYVSRDYCGKNTLTIDTSVGKTVQQAGQNARNIVKKYEYASDYNKLLGYCNELCTMVEYNYPAADEDWQYGNPWQLIWALDGDPSTDVVCEGYSKAFQYLCQLSRFSKQIDCFTVTGDLWEWGFISDDWIKSGPHMWNIVCMPDGRSYLVDVTNVDGDGGFPELFMAGTADGNTADGYDFFVADGAAALGFVYDEDTLNLLLPSELELAEHPYLYYHEASDDFGATGVRDMKNCRIQVENAIYNGKARKPLVTVFDGDELLSETLDYTLTYANNNKLGTGSVTVKGTGRYGGSVTKNFQITLKTPYVSLLENVRGGIKVTWEKVSGAEKYRLYYRIGTGSWTKAADTTSTSYVWKKAVSGKRYTFMVRCLSKDGKTLTSGGDSLGRSITYYAAPGVSKLENVNGGIKITWAKSAGAPKYRIYYLVKGSNQWKKLAETTSTSYTWKKPVNGKGYTFCVVCLSKDGKSILSGDGTAKSITHISTPIISSASNLSGRKLKLTWKKVSGVTGYQIQYSTSKSFQSGNKTVTVKGVSSLSKTIYSLTKKKTYYVRIRSYKTISGSNTYSGWSSIKAVTIKK